MTSVREAILPALEACAAGSASSSATCVLNPPSVSLQAASISAIAANAVSAKMLVDVGRPVILPRPKARANARLDR
jgi:hypothetical protein